MIDTKNVVDTRREHRSVDYSAMHLEMFGYEVSQSDSVKYTLIAVYNTYNTYVYDR